MKLVIWVVPAKNFAPLKPKLKSPADSENLFEVLRIKKKASRFHKRLKSKGSNETWAFPENRRGTKSRLETMVSQKCCRPCWWRAQISPPISLSFTASDAKLTLSRLRANKTGEVNATLNIGSLGIIDNSPTLLWFTQRLTNWDNNSHA